jgi:hypothetical protein
MSALIEKYTTAANPGSYSGLSGFKKNNKFKSYKPLLTYPTYALHKQAIRKFPRRQTIVHERDEEWQIDLLDVRKFKTLNSHYEYMLCAIDVLSKFAWVEPIKKKTAEACAEAFQKIFLKGRIPKMCYADLGNEFKGAVRSLFKKHNIIQLDTKSVNKASVCERFIRTLKEKLERFYTESGKHKYVDVLQDVVKSYNNSIHTSTKMAPSQVTLKTAEKARENLYGPDDMKIENDYHVHFEFKVGSYVRSVIQKSIFDKGYIANWSKEVYLVYFLNPSNPPTYKIKSLDGIEYDKNYYKQELQLVSNQEFPYDTFEIIDQNKNQVLVKQLNSEDQTIKWIKRVQPIRAVKK